MQVLARVSFVDEKAEWIVVLYKIPRPVFVSDPRVQSLQVSFPVASRWPVTMVFSRSVVPDVSTDFRFAFFAVRDPAR